MWLGSTVVWIAWTAMLQGPVQAMDCQCLSGARVAMNRPELSEVQARLNRGDTEGARREFRRWAEGVGVQADRLLFNGDRDTAEETAQWVDKTLRGERNLVVVRGDGVTLSADTYAWGAYVACLAGRLDEALLWLGNGWRDYGEERFQVEAAALAAARGGFQADVPDDPEARPRGKP